MRLSTNIAQLDIHTAGMEPLEPVSEEYDTSWHRQARKGYMGAHAERDTLARYAVKRIRRRECMDAVLDLACEAQFLQHLPHHANIIRLRGTVGVPKSPDFMLILDRLTHTLQTRMCGEWKARYQRYRGSKMARYVGIANTKNHRKEGWESLMLERIGALWDIASALSHLHHHRIVYRDLKPENVGVDVRGDMRLFDFGLARELKDRDLVQAPDDYDITGLTGSHRYMAPEVMICHPYGLSADVYSFGMLMWHVMALQEPFGKYCTKQLYDKVVVAGERPHRIAGVDAVLHNLMERCWSVHRKQRPSFDRICEVLETKIGTDHISTRSHCSFDSFCGNVEST
jgi:serine/threonine protein kinase